MTQRGHWIAIALVPVAFAVAASADTLNRRRPAPAAASRPPATATATATATDPTQLTCDVAARVVRDIAASGHAPAGVPLRAAFPSSTETVGSQVVSVARMPSTLGPTTPTCFCRPTRPPSRGSMHCTASVIRDVHHQMLLTFSVSDSDVRLDGIQTMVGGW